MPLKKLSEFPPAQQRILRVLARLDGSSNRKIAEEVGNSEGTVKVQISHILDRSDCARNRMALSLWAKKLVDENA